VAIAVNNTSSGGVTISGSPYTLTWSHTVGSGSNRILIVSASARGNSSYSPMTATYNGVAMTLAVTNVYDDGFECRNSIFYMLNPPSGANNIVVTCANQVQHIGGGAVDITGAEQQAPEATNSTAYGSGGTFSSMSTSITSVTDSAIIIDGGGCDGNATVGSGGGGWGSGQTAFVNANQASSLMYSGSYEVFATAGATSQTQSWVDFACNRGAQCVAVFAEYAGASVTEKLVYVGEDTSVSAGSTLVLDVPTNTADGDLLIAWVVNEDDDPNASWTPPSGWTEYVPEMDTGGSPVTPPTLTVYYRRASSEPSSYTWTLSASGRGLMGAMLSYRNVDSLTPFDASYTTATGTSGTPNPPSITTVTEGAWVVATGFSDNDVPVYTALSSGYTVRVNSADDSGSGNGANLGICDLLVAAAGATNPAAFSGTGGEEWGAVTMALKQALPTIDNTSEGLGTTTTVTVSHTFSAGDNKKLIVFAGAEYNGAINVTNVTYNGVALTQVTEIDVGSGFTCNLAAWYLDDVNFPGTPGAYNVVVTYSQTPADGLVHIVGLEGAEQGAPEAYNTSTALSQQTLTTNVTTLTDDALILGSLHLGDNGLATPTTGQEILEETTGSSNEQQTGAERIPDAGATSMGWDGGSSRNRLLQIVLAIAPFSGAAELRNTFYGWEH